MVSHKLSSTQKQFLLATLEASCAAVSCFASTTLSQECSADVLKVCQHCEVANKISLLIGMTDVMTPGTCIQLCVMDTAERQSWHCSRRGRGGLQKAGPGYPTRSAAGASGKDAHMPSCIYAGMPAYTQIDKLAKQPSHIPGRSPRSLQRCERASSCCWTHFLKPRKRWHNLLIVSDRNLDKYMQ